MHRSSLCGAITSTYHALSSAVHVQERLEKYDKKVRKALAVEELASTRPAVTLDIAAANRFIDHAIPDLSKEQKERLKQVCQAVVVPEHDTWTCLQVHVRITACCYVHISCILPRLHVSASGRLAV